MRQAKAIIKSTLLSTTLLFSTLQAQADNVTFTSSDLPIIIIQTQAAINADAKVPGTMKIIDNGPGQTNSVGDAPNGFDGFIGIKWRGESSLNFNQKKYTVETWDALGNDSVVSIFDMPEESDWVLLAPYNDVSMVRDVYAYGLWNQMGHWGPRTRMCEVVVNNEYMGVYAFCERIKRDKNRVDIAKLKPEDTTGRDVSGGYIVRIDAFDNEDVTFQSKVMGIQKSNWGWGGSQSQESPVTWTIYYPKKEDLIDAQKQYIQNYVDSAELAIQSPDFTDPVKGYSNFIDVPSFVDYFIHTELSLNADGFKRSAYYYKEKDKKDGTRGKLFAGPVWDYNLAYGNCSFCNANNVTSWVYEGCETNPTPKMWKRLLQDPNFCNAVKTRYTQLRQNILSNESVNEFIDSYATMLNQAKDRQLKKYKEILKSDSWWDFSPTSMFAAYRVGSYAEEIQIIKKWFADRLNFLDNNLPGEYVDNTAIRPLQYLDADFMLNERQVSVASPLPLQRIDVTNVLGAQLLSARYNAQSDVCLDLSALPEGLCVVICYATDGSMFSRTIMLR
ncbi:MAG: CotH kinase family protein [Prevotella sp.]|nr:CotH kinase family protein [Prevotella sp.]